MMRAVVCREYGPPEALRIEEQPALAPAAGEVVVSVRASGLNFTDLLATSGRSQMKVRPPFTPGVEVAGIVKATGAGVTSVREGDRVFGSCFHGGHADEVRFKELEVAPLPAAMNFTAGAAFYIASNTALYSLHRRARLRAGETLLVLGAGSGVGLAAIDIGKALGAHVTAAASSEPKLALAREHGADLTMRYPTGPLNVDDQKQFCAALRAHTQGAGYAVILDGVGGSYAEPALRALAREGRFVSVGFAAGVPSIPLSVALFRNADIMGIELSSPEEREPGRNRDGVALLMGWIESGRLRPHVTEIYPLEAAAQGLRQLLDRRAAGRIVLSR